MASFFIKIRFFMVLWWLTYTAVHGSQQCPASCVCKNLTGVCVNLTSSIQTPFPDNTTSVFINQCRDMSLRAGIFGVSVENIKIHNCLINEIESFAFSNLPSLKELSFKNVFIDYIRPCAVHYIHSPASIIFDNSQILQIDAGAFSEMSSLQKISFTRTTVDRTESYAFYNIQVRNFTISDSDFKLLNSLAFSSIRDVTHFSLYQLNSETVADRAFSNLSNIENVKMEKCRFNDLQCKAIMSLREATPGNHDNFVFTNSTIQCTCSILPLLSYLGAHGNFLTNSVLCEYPIDTRFNKFKLKPVSSITVDALKQICKPSELSQQKCLSSDPEPPSCHANVSTTPITSTDSYANVSSTIISTEISSTKETTTRPNAGMAYIANENIMSVIIVLVILFV